jgi:PKD repeat protein
MLVLMGLLLLAGASAAPAAADDTFCVPTGGTGCVNAGSLTLQTALNDAGADLSNATVKIAAGTYTCPAGGFTVYSGDDTTVDVVGAGTGQTILTCPANFNIADNEIAVLDADGAVNVSALTIHEPAGPNEWGMMVSGGTVDGIAVDSDAAATGAFGIVLFSGTLRDLSVDLPASQDDIGIEAEGGTIDDADVSTGGTAIYPSGTTVITHSTLKAPWGVWTDGGNSGGTPDVYDSLIELEPGVAVGEYGLVANSQNPGAAAPAISGRNLTIVGGDAGSVGIAAIAGFTDQTSSITLSDSVISGPATALERSAVTGGTANLTASYDDYPAGTYTGTGAGSTTESDVLHAGPDFLDPATGAFALAAGSPLIDAGTPGGLAPGEPATDLAGDPRILAGNGTCVARRDIGAYEYDPTTLPATARASVTTALTGVAVKFTATGCSVDPSLAPTFSWHFDDGATAAGASVTHAFATPGVHHATVTVRDSAGRTGVATASVTIRVLAPALSALRISPKSFRPAARGGSVATATGAMISYRDSEAARTTFEVQKRLPGVVRGKRCVAPPRHHKRGAKLKRCTRRVVLGTFSHADVAGANHLLFTGRTGGHALKRGSYVLSAVARNRDGLSRAVTVAFKIVG